MATAPPKGLTAAPAAEPGCFARAADAILLRFMVGKPFPQRARMAVTFIAFVINIFGMIFGFMDIRSHFAADPYVPYSAGLQRSANGCP